MFFGTLLEYGFWPPPLPPPPSRNGSTKNCIVIGGSTKNCTVIGQLIGEALGEVNWRHPWQTRQGRRAELGEVNWRCPWRTRRGRRAVQIDVIGEALGEVNWRRPWRTRRGRRPTLGLGASGKWMMVRMITIIHLPEGSTQPAVYKIQLGGTSP